jgi:hypothetical protein
LSVDLLVLIDFQQISYRVNGQDGPEGGQGSVNLLQNERLIFNARIGKYDCLYRLGSTQPALVEDAPCFPYAALKPFRVVFECA